MRTCIFRDKKNSSLSHFSADAQPAHFSADAQPVHFSADAQPAHFSADAQQPILVLMHSSPF